MSLALSLCFLSFHLLHTLIYNYTIITYWLTSRISAWAGCHTSLTVSRLNGGNIWFPCSFFFHFPVLLLLYYSFSVISNRAPSDSHRPIWNRTVACEANVNIWDRAGKYHLNTDSPTELFISKCCLCLGRCLQPVTKSVARHMDILKGRVWQMASECLHVEKTWPCHPLETTVRFAGGEPGFRQPQCASESGTVCDLSFALRCCFSSTCSPTAPPPPPFHHLFLTP